MGQKANPYSLRLGYIKDWKSKWFARKEYAHLLHEDLKIRSFIKKKLRTAGIADVTIERSAGKLRLTVFTARPGIIIGRGGQEINKLRDELAGLTPVQITLDIKEVQNPQTNAQLIAENIALQLEKRVAFRKAMKKAVSSAMSKGCLGIKLQTKGRLGGTEIARSEGYKEGKVPLSTFRSDVCYGFAEAQTTYGKIGVKVWTYHGDILVKKQEAERRKQLEEARLLEEKQEAGKASSSEESSKKTKSKKGKPEDVAVGTPSSESAS